MSLLTRLLRFFFHHFYHEFAWSYDLVASVVSVGRWNHWIRAAVPFLRGKDILEVGFGRGHLQDQLLAHPDLRVFGIDESSQMAQMAHRYLGSVRGLKPAQLARARAQELPFSASAFDSVVSTFPSEYIFDPASLHEIARVLRPAGRLVVILGASIVGRGLIDRLASWISVVSHQAPRAPEEVLSERLKERLAAAGFQARFQILERASSLVFMMEAERKR